MPPAPHEIDVDEMRALAAASRGPAAGYLAAARAGLRRMAATPGLLDARALPRTPGGYARHLVFGDGEISVWAMMWDVGARTPVHDHHCSCCYGVVSGALREVRFEAVGEGAAVIAGQEVRRAGSVACLLPSGPNLHQMVNDGAGEAVSLHVYGFDHRRRASSVRREYRVARQ